MACYGGLWGILTRRTESTDHPSMSVHVSADPLGNYCRTLIKKPLVLSPQYNRIPIESPYESFRNPGALK